jgi:hypothetical protein
MEEQENGPPFMRRRPLRGEYAYLAFAQRQILNGSYHEWHRASLHRRPVADSRIPRHRMYCGNKSSVGVVEDGIFGKQLRQYVGVDGLIDLSCLNVRHDACTMPEHRRQQ